MATVYRRKRTYPIPDGAEIVTYRGKRYAKWTDPKTGKAERAPLNKAEDKIIVESEFYTVQYFDHNGKRRKVYTRYPDKDAAQQYANQLEKQAEDRRRGVVDVKTEQHVAQARRPISEHLTEFRQYLQDKQNSPKHVELVCSRVGKLIDDCKAEQIGDLTDVTVMAAIGAMKAGGASLQTCNHYIRGIKQFSRWLKLQKRTPDDALAALAGFNAETDRRYVRRELQSDELGYLLRTVETYTTANHNMPGPDRAMAYRLALGTGFRAKELRSLSPASFDLDGHPATVTVTAGYSKRRRQDTQPIRRDLAELLRPWLGNYGRDDHPFAKMPEATARMLRDDLNEARRRWLEEARSDAERAERKKSDFLKHKDADGRVVDFHATRHTYISGIVASGASVKTAQELARHSTPTLTIGRYSHVRLHDLTAALDALPDLTTPPATTATPEMLAATGTSGSGSGGHHVGQYSGKMGREAANHGERFDGCQGAETDAEQGEDGDRNVLLLRDLAGCDEQAADRGESDENERRRWESNPRMAVLQTAALATWLRRQHFRRLKNVMVPVKRICGT